MEVSDVPIGPKSPAFKFGCGSCLGILLGLIGIFAVFLYLELRHPTGYDELITAIDAKNQAAVDRLLQSGVNPNDLPDTFLAKTLESDVLPLNEAASEGDASVMTTLLEHGADPNKGDGWYQSPLQCAATHDNVEVMQVLLQSGVKVNNDSYGSIALWAAAAEGNIASVHFLLAHGADPNSRSKYETLIGWLREDGGSSEVIDALTAAGGH